MHLKRPFVLYVMHITACIDVLVEMDKGIKYPWSMVHPNHYVYQKIIHDTILNQCLSIIPVSASQKFHRSKTHHLLSHPHRRIDGTASSRGGLMYSASRWPNVLDDCDFNLAAPAAEADEGRDGEYGSWSWRPPLDDE